MTLTTSIYVHDNVDIDELLHHGRTLLARFDEHGRTPEQHEPYDDTMGRHHVRGNRLGQSLPAILWAIYDANGPYRAEADTAKQHDGCEDDCDGSDHPPACWVEISLDTAYGYKGPDGMGCGDLHAVLVAEYGRWLDQRGIAWSWRNEFTGETHTGYHGLIELGPGGASASEWFRTTVVPAITKHVAT